MNGPNGKPTKPDDDFKPLAPALEKQFGKKFARLPAKLRKRITRDRRAAMLTLLWDGTTPGRQRSMAQLRDWDDDPANKDEAEFCFEVPFRKTKLEAMKAQAQNVAAPDAVALAMRNAMLFHMDKAIDALPKDEEEVRSALPAKLKATIERVRRRWTELDKRAAVLGSEGFSWVLASVGGQPAGAAENVRGWSGVGAKPVPRQDQEINLPKPDGEVTQWHADWSNEHPLAADEEAWTAAKIKFPEKGVKRQVIRNMRQNPDGSHRPTGRKPGKSESEFR